MTHHGFWPARENSGNEVTLSRELPVAEGINAAPEPLQLACLDALVDAIVAKPTRRELCVRDHPKLLRRNPRRRPV
jgi:hypothetical protein